MLKALYVIAIGLLFASFVGYGVSVFYPAPEPPEFPRTAEPFSANDTEQSDEQRRLQESTNLEYEQKSETFRDELKVYNQNLSIILLIISVAVLIVSILGVGTVAVIGDGLTLGGVFVLFYALMRAFMAEGEIFSFIAVSIGLAIVIFLAYWKFVRPPKRLIAP
jgi:hypothetical protein